MADSLRRACRRKRHANLARSLADGRDHEKVGMRRGIAAVLRKVRGKYGLAWARVKRVELGMLSKATLRAEDVALAWAVEVQKL